MDFVYDLGADPAKRLEDARSMAKKSYYTLEGNGTSGLLRKGILIVGAYELDGSNLTIRIYLPPPGFTREQVDAQLSAFLGSRP